jgi:TIR domain
MQYRDCEVFVKLVRLFLNPMLLQGGLGWGFQIILFLLVILFPIVLIIFIAIVRWFLRSPKKALLNQVPVKTATAIFISYRRDDSSDVTGRIYDRLIQHFGKHSVFKDVDSIPLGVDFRKHLGDSLGRCDVLLTIIGKQWLIGDMGQRRLDDVRDFVRLEIEAALQRDIPVIPVLVRAASVPRQEDLPETLRSLVYQNGIPVRPDPDFHQDMDRLIRGIEGCLR